MSIRVGHRTRLWYLRSYTSSIFCNSSVIRRVIVSIYSNINSESRLDKFFAGIISKGI